MNCIPKLELYRDDLDQDCDGKVDEECGTCSLSIQDGDSNQLSDFLLVKRVK